MPPAVSVCVEEGNENDQSTLVTSQNFACSSASSQDDPVAASASPSSSPPTGYHHAASTSDVARGSGVEDGEASSQAVRLLDEELMELERLITLQRKKVEGLQRVREQYLAGHRYGAVDNDRRNNLNSRTIVGLMPAL